MPDIGGTVVEDSEDFLYLDDEEGDLPSKKPGSSKIKLPKIAIPKRKTTKNTKPIEKTSEEPPDSEAIEISLDGIFQFDWGSEGWTARTVR